MSVSDAVSVNDLTDDEFDDCFMELVNEMSRRYGLTFTIATLFGVAVKTVVDSQPARAAK